MQDITQITYFIWKSTYLIVVYKLFLLFGLLFWHITHASLVKLLETFHPSCISKTCNCAEYQQERNIGKKKQTEKGITRHETQEMSAVDTSTKLFTTILNQRVLVHMFSHKCHFCNASRREHFGGEACWGSRIGTQDLSS